MPQQSVRIAVVMDPIEHIKPKKDTTLAMLLAAQQRGWDLQYLELGHLWLRDGVAMGRAHPLAVREHDSDWFTRGEPVVSRLGDFDAILMRKDPPFDTEYIYSTYVLERAEAQGALVVNRPQGLRHMNEKVYTAWFPQCCAPTLIPRDMPDMHAFLREHGRIVCKPLHGMGAARSSSSNWATRMRTWSSKRSRSTARVSRSCNATSPTSSRPATRE